MTITFEGIFEMLFLIKKKLFLEYFLLVFTNTI